MITAFCADGYHLSVIICSSVILDYKLFGIGAMFLYSVCTAWSQSSTNHYGYSIKQPLKKRYALEKDCLSVKRSHDKENSIIRD